MAQIETLNAQEFVDEILQDLISHLETRIKDILGEKITDVRTKLENKRAEVRTELMTFLEQNKNKDRLHLLLAVRTSEIVAVIASNNERNSLRNQLAGVLGDFFRSKLNGGIAINKDA